MYCNKCNQSDPCITCEKNEACDCIQKDMSTDCSVYTGDKLECSGIEKNTLLTVTIKKLDEFICNVKDSILGSIVQSTTLLNVGAGSKVFKQINGLGNKELRTISSDDLTLVDIIENTETINIKPGLPNLTKTGDTLNFTVTTLAGETNYGSVVLESNTLNTFVQSASFNENTSNITITRNNGEPSIIIPISSLNNHIESGEYNSNNINITLTDNSIIPIDLTSLINQIILQADTNASENQIKSDILETDISSKAFIENKNPTKTVLLGASGNYNVLDSDNNYVIEVDNGVNNITIDFSSITNTDNFFVGFIQKGTGNVTFTNADVIPQDFTNILYGQGHVASLEVLSGTKYLAGTLKIQAF